ncbi:Putative transcriptional regulator, TetR [Mycobacteroides abscessus subsp. massiliense]|nr:Putative transcriptional regulator, TetR [Mycobacteroides abscessus subsp. massiliense]
MEDPAEAPIRMADRQRARRSELVKEEVVEAALAEFSERGYHQTSIAHIAERLGTGHSMFYRYFTNKRDILEHVVQHATQRTVETLSHTLPGRITSLDEFHDFAVNLGLAYIGMVVADPRLSRLMLQQGAAVDAEMTAQFCQVFDAGASDPPGNTCPLRARPRSGHSRITRTRNRRPRLPGDRPLAGIRRSR